MAALYLSDGVHSGAMRAISRYNVGVFGEAASNGVRAVINLMADDGPRLALGRLSFYDDGASVPADGESEDGLILVNLPMSAFAGVVALLQHDRPVKLGLVGGRGVLRTGEWERVGETELGQGG